MERSLMLQDDWETATDLDLSTDASGTLGFGAYFQGAWIMGTWVHSTALQIDPMERIVCNYSRSSHLG